MEKVQLIQVTPEQLQNAIIKGVNSKIEDLKQCFQPKEPTVYLERNEVSKMLKINLSTLHNWTKKGILKSYGIGRRTYYKRVEVENAIVELKAKSDE